jgi:hypothetical protein
MQTISEILGPEREARERARQYEVALNHRDRMRSDVERLKNLVANAAHDTAALEQMHKLCGQVPAHLITRGSRFVAGGFVGRDFLMVVVGDLLSEATRKADEDKAALDAARRKLAQAEARVKAVSE